MRKTKVLSNLMDEMHKISAEIGKLEIERNLGERFVSTNEIDAKRREFNKLQTKHKTLFFKE